MKTTNLIFALTLTALFSLPFGKGRGWAQNVGINSTGAAPNASALLDIDGTTGGLLIPRMTTAQRDNIPTACSCTPADGLQIFNTTTKCLEFYYSGSWYNIACTCNIPNIPVATAGTGIIATQFTANWATTAGATSYNLYVDDNNDFSSPLAGYNPLTGIITLNQNVTGLTCGTTYYYRVTAVNSCGTSGTSNIITVTTTFTPGSQVFSYTGAVQTWAVPSCVTSVTITALGAGASGLGGKVVATYAVTPLDVLNIYVGGTFSGATNGTGGWNGGGSTNFGPGTGWSQGGGGASDVRFPTVAMADRIIVAGGGGGSGGCAGGAGGNTTGAAGGTCSGGGGGGGTPGVGGGGGAGSGGYSDGIAGTLGVGGNGGAGGSGGSGADGGAGGGGYYGGGGGGGAVCCSSGGGGGGGSSYTIPSATGVIHTQGFQTGNGQVTITW